MSDDLNILISEMDNLWLNFKSCRVPFPASKRNLIGKKKIPIQPYYLQRGFYVTLLFNQTIDGEKFAKMHSVAHWINQNFIIRLCALIESYQIRFTEENIDKNLEGVYHGRIVHLLRNSFAHSSGRYNRCSSGDRYILKLMNKHLGLNLRDENRTEFPLDINIILKPLFDGCKKYVEEKTRISERAKTADRL